MRLLKGVGRGTPRYIIENAMEDSARLFYTYCVFESRYKCVDYLCREQCKLFQQRVSRVEQHFGDLCLAIAAYTRKTSRLRDKGNFLCIS